MAPRWRSRRLSEEAVAIEEHDVGADQPGPGGADTVRTARGRSGDSGQDDVRAGRLRHPHRTAPTQAGPACAQGMKNDLPLVLVSVKNAASNMRPFRSCL